MLKSLELPVTLERFYQLFLADGAPYALDWYQENYVGDRDIELTGWDVDTDEHVLKRSMTFTHPISNVVGPSQARTTRHQRLQRFDDFGILVENTTVIVDNIPSADAFYVHDNWVIQGSALDPHSVTLTTRFAARFTKRVLFRGLIEKSVVKETTKWFQGYAEMIQSKAQKALEAKTGADESQRIASERPPPHIVQKPAIPTATDSNLPMIIDLLQRISASMNTALMVGGCAVALLFCILVYQLVLMRSTVEIMKQELMSLRIEIARDLPHEIHHDCKVATVSS
jgi:VAD1 Analog of StAR-related lipid transfer domain